MTTPTTGLKATLLLHMGVHRLGIWLMWAILGAILAINMALHAIFTPLENGSANGALAALPCYMVVAAIITAARELPFALAVGLTRARFFFQSLLVTAALSLLWAGVAASLSGIEAATDGWGMHMQFFRLTGRLAGAWWETFGLIFVALLTSFAAGWCFGIVHRRWGTPGVLVTIGAVLALAVAGVMLTVAPQIAPAASRVWGQMTMGPLIGAIAAVAVCLGGIGYVLTRRTAV